MVSVSDTDTITICCDIEAPNRLPHQTHGSCSIQLIHPREFPTVWIISSDGGKWKQGLGS